MMEIVFLMAMDMNVVQKLQMVVHVILQVVITAVEIHAVLKVKHVNK